MKATVNAGKVVQTERVTVWLLISDRFAPYDGHLIFDSPEDFVAECAQIWPDKSLELSWRCGGDEPDYYVDQTGEAVLEAIGWEEVVR